MHVIDKQKGITLEGRCVEIIPAGEPPSDAQLRRVWKTVPGSLTFSILARPTPGERLIMQLGDDEDSNYYVVSNQPHYELSALK